ncbi:hexameric tyrosine-coordinated heme protein [Vibrio alginolyticus]|nr:peroxidase [Vibrio alginolyticus]EJS2612084.1 hexameric tyrosine-coordinated heme protein [Vibrio alginolyticus]ELB2803289.1 hexameric tyrosine-coordinated heme protein [Vibrio alginolyticus]ELB2807659.1 hexameric tyrosine-coordinated heme protein [Vibrio alginolyticus]ELB2845934.1 hexameric tyrosine-coordinated heme protein [Vibrio alginolyticus]
MEQWLPSLITETPSEGFELAINLSRMGVKKTQPNVEILHKLRPEYSENASLLIESSKTIAMYFQTISQANNYWKDC